MLQGMTWASPPAFLMPEATSSQASALRLEIATLAPSLASSSADDRPMPRLEPVMTATRPLRSNGVDCMGHIPLLSLVALFRHGPAKAQRVFRATLLALMGVLHHDAPKPARPSW